MICVTKVDKKSCFVTLCEYSHQSTKSILDEIMDIYLQVIFALFLSNTQNLASDSGNITYDLELQSITINSEILHRSIDVKYHIGDDDHIVYFTDGQKMIDNGAWEEIQKLIQEDEIKNSSIVFISTIDKVSGIDYRDEYFFCNAMYTKFLETELIPTIESKMDGQYLSIHRSIVGISFGGLNATWLLTSTSFGGYGILSPITYPCPDILSKIVFSDLSKKHVILSSGKNDAEVYMQPISNLLKPRCKRLKTINTNGGHDFENWIGQIHEVFDFLLST